MTPAKTYTRKQISIALTDWGNSNQKGPFFAENFIVNLLYRIEPTDFVSKWIAAWGAEELVDKKLGELIESLVDGKVKQLNGEITTLWEEIKMLKTRQATHTLINKTES